MVEFPKKLDRDDQDQMEEQELVIYCHGLPLNIDQSYKYMISLPAVTKLMKNLGSL